MNCGYTALLFEILWGENKTTIYNVTIGLSRTESQTAGQTTSLRVARRDGSGFYLNAKIGEHIRYSGSKESSRIGIHNMFNEKWGVSV